MDHGFNHPPRDETVGLSPSAHCDTSGQATAKYPMPSLDMMVRQTALYGQLHSAGLCTLYAVEAESWICRGLRFDPAVTEIGTPTELREALQSTKTETLLALLSPLLTFEKLLAMCAQSPLSKTVFYEVKP